MDGRSPLRMKLLIVFLLVSTNIVCLHGSNTTGNVFAIIFFNYKKYDRISSLLGK